MAVRTTGGRVRRTAERLSLAVLAAQLARPFRSARPVGPSDVGATGATRATGADGTAGATRATGAGGAAGAGVGRAVPVTLGGTLARQTSPTTCGSAVLVMLAATGDPALARWLDRGELAAAPPPEIPPEAPSVGSGTDRLAAAQRRVQARTSARAVGPVPWPSALGTPPWTAAREARFPGVRYRSVPVDDAGAAARHLLASVHAATLAGVPVPLYTGGDLGGGLRAAVPRHVVLAVPPPADAPHRGHDGAGRRVLHLYEPSSGTVRPVPLAELVRRDAPHPALGGWTHVCWVVLPVPATSTVAGRTGGR